MMLFSLLGFHSWSKSPLQVKCTVWIEMVGIKMMGKIDGKNDWKSLEIREIEMGKFNISRKWS